MPRVSKAIRETAPVLDWLPGAVAVLRGSTIVYANERFAMLTGLSVSQIRDADASTVMSPEALADIVAEASGARGQDVVVTVPFGGKGRVVPWKAVCRMTDNVDGESVLTLTVSHIARPDAPVAPDAAALLDQLDASVRQVSHYFANTIQAVLIQLMWSDTRAQDRPVREVLSDVSMYLGTMSRLFALDARWPDSDVMLGDMVQHVVDTVAAPMGLQCVVDARGHRHGVGVRQIDRRFRFQVSMVLSELITNAAKHGSSGGARVRLQSDSGDHACVTVSNEGRLPRVERRGRGGLSLAERMLPAAGAQLSVTQRGADVRAALCLTAPVISQ